VTGETYAGGASAYAGGVSAAETCALSAWASASLAVEPAFGVVESVAAVAAVAGVVPAAPVVCPAVAGPEASPFSACACAACSSSISRMEISMVLVRSFMSDISPILQSQPISRPLGVTTYQSTKASPPNIMVKNSDGSSVTSSAS
jgi:hypothetical protein